MFKNLLKLFAVSILLFTIGNTQSVFASEYLTTEQIEQVVSGLDDEAYVIPTPDGGFITNINGSSYFPEEQIKTFGEAMTVSEYKEFLNTFDITVAPQQNTGTLFRSAQAPWVTYTLYANQLYKSNPFSGSGWRYGGYIFYPQPGTGNFLYWQSIGDSGRVVDGNGFNTVIENGSYVPIDSKFGTYFKTNNPVNGSYYIVSNPV